MAWTTDEIATAIEWYGESTGLTVFADVPLARPDWRGWGPDCVPRVDAVAVRVDGGGGVRTFEEGAFEEAVAGGGQIRPLLVWGYADRPGFGWLATAQALLARTWRPAGPVLPVALVKSGSARSNVAPTYFAAGFDILAIPGEAPAKRGGGGGALAANDPWENPQSGEDRLLHKLRDRRGGDDWWLAEVPIGTGSPRRLDAIVVPWPEPRVSAAGRDLESLRAAAGDGAEVELIEAKRQLNVAVIGQLLCGAAMFSEAFPGHGRLSLTACVRAAGNEALEWFCVRHGVRVETVSV